MFEASETSTTESAWCTVTPADAYTDRVTDTAITGNHCRLASETDQLQPASQDRSSHQQQQEPGTDRITAWPGDGQRASNNPTQALAQRLNHRPTPTRPTNRSTH